MSKPSTPPALQPSRTRLTSCQPSLIVSLISHSLLAIPVKKEEQYGVTLKGEHILRERTFYKFLQLLQFLWFFIALILVLYGFSTLWIQYFGFKILGYCVLWILGCFSCLNYALICTFAFVAIQYFQLMFCIYFSTLVPLLDLVSLMQLPQWSCID